MYIYIYVCIYLLFLLPPLIIQNNIYTHIKHTFIYMYIIIKHIIFQPNFTFQLSTMHCYTTSTLPTKITFNSLFITLTFTSLTKPNTLHHLLLNFPAFSKSISYPCMYFILSTFFLIITPFFQNRQLFPFLTQNI